MKECKDGVQVKQLDLKPTMCLRWLEINEYDSVYECMHKILQQKHIHDSGLEVWIDIQTQVITPDKQEYDREYEYEVFIKEEDCWIPIQNKMIRNKDKIDKYIKNGLLRKINKHTDNNSLRYCINHGRSHTYNKKDI